MEKRHAFAKHFGSGHITCPPSSGYRYDVNGNLHPLKKRIHVPRCKYWSSHFPGTRNFTTSITTTDITFDENAIESNYRLGTFTGLRLYPYPTEVGKRPYRLCISPYRYKQVNASGEELNTRL